MGEMRRVAGPLPHDQQSTGEHFKEVEEDPRHEHEADRIARATPSARGVWSNRSARP
jgi:hypothetical protein